jgi:hypothetical protein
VGILRILEEGNVLHRWDGVQPVLLRAHANNDLRREHLSHKLERILLRCTHGLDGQRRSLRVIREPFDHEQPVRDRFPRKSRLMQAAGTLPPPNAAREPREPSDSVRRKDTPALRAAGCASSLS